MARRVASGSDWSISAMMERIRCSSAVAATAGAGAGAGAGFGFGGLGAGAGFGTGTGAGAGSTTGLTGEGVLTAEAFDRRMQSQAQLMISEASAPRLVSCG